MKRKEDTASAVFSDSYYLTGFGDRNIILSVLTKRRRKSSGEEGTKELCTSVRGFFAFWFLGFIITRVVHVPHSCDEPDWCLGGVFGKVLKFNGESKTSEV